MKRYVHPYGGTCTVIGEFVPRDLFDWMKKSGRESLVEVLRRNYVAARHQPQKILDVPWADDGELLAYSTTTDHIRLEVINR